MKYLTIFKSLDSEITTTAGGSSNAVFPFTKPGVEAFRVYANEFTIFGELVKSGDAGLYMTEASSPVELPFDMNLNYVDLKNAKKLDPKNLERAIQVMSQYDSGDIINSGNYIDIDTFQERESPFASSMNHSREQLIHILSSIAVTLGSVVSSEAQWRHESTMAHQVLITRPMVFVRIPHEQAVEILAGESTFDPFHMRRDEDDVDRGEYGMGGDWWKDPQEAIMRIANIISEDPDLF